MLLILAKPEDSLAHAVTRVARRSATDVVVWGNPEMLNRQEPTLSLDCIGCDSSSVSAADVTGVLFRLPACWWRTAAANDDHDLIGAWYTLLWDLPCPVVNRFALSWWFDQPGYALELSLHMNAALTSTRGAASAEDRPATVYMAGTALIPADANGRLAAERLNAHAAALKQWQSETGVTLARFTFGSDRAARVAVDPCPDFAGESAEVIEQVADAIYSRLMERL
jgi:hypothetical protein